MDIVSYLYKSGLQSVNDISAGTSIEQSAVSHGLNKLLACEVVHVEVRGKHRYYSLNEETIVPLLQIVDQHIVKFCHNQCSQCSGGHTDKEGG